MRTRAEVNTKCLPVRESRGCGSLRSHALTAAALASDWLAQVSSCMLCCVGTVLSFNQKHQTCMDRGVVHVSPVFSLGLRASSGTDDIQTRCGERRTSLRAQRACSRAVGSFCFAAARISNLKQAFKM